MADDDGSLDAAPSTSRARFHGSGAPTKNECVTQVKPIILTQQWTVDNFANLLKLARPGLCLRSSIFRDNQVPDACWQLCLYPGGKRDENANHVSLFLKMSATSPMKEVLIKAEYRFFFLDDDGQPRFSNVNIGDFHAKPPKGGHSWGLRNIPKPKVQGCVRRDGSLVISCAIELIPDPAKLVPKKLGPQTPLCDATIAVSERHVEEERQLLSDHASADFVLQVGDVQLHVHRCKLMAHSPVLRAMFSHPDIAEVRESRLTMSDFSAGAVRLMLEFLYTGMLTSEMTLEDACEVIQLSEKYDVPALKVACERTLISHTTKENVCDHLEMSDMYGADYVFQHCLQQLVLWRNTVIEQQAWQQLKNRNPRLTSNVLERIFVMEGGGNGQQTGGAHSHHGGDGRGNVVRRHYSLIELL